MDSLRVELLVTPRDMDILRTLQIAIDQRNEAEARATRAEQERDRLREALTQALDESGHTKFCRAYQDIGECDCWYDKAWAAVEETP